MRVSNENNEHQQLPEDIVSSCYKIVSPIYLQKLINDFASYKHYNVTFLLDGDVSHGFWYENYIFGKGATLFNRLT